MAAHASILGWEIPWTEEPGGLQFMGSQRARHDWVSRHARRTEFVFHMVWMIFWPMAEWVFWIILFVRIRDLFVPKNVPRVSHPLVAYRAELMNLGGEWALDHGSTSPVLCPTKKTHAGSSWYWPWPSNWEFADVILYSKTFQTSGCKPYFILCRLEN